MIPQPITLDGRTGTIVYMDAHWQPVTPEQATMAKVVFDDGSVAFYTATEGGHQEGLGGLTRKFDASQHPRGEDGRFIEASQPRIFNRPSEVGSYSSWGGGMRWGWKDPATGEVTGRLLTGEPIAPADVPATLYHVTTNAPAVESSGVLLGQLGDAGLGGGQAPGVSFTSDPTDAVVIQRELRRAIRIARGEDYGLEAIRRYAREDEQEAGLPAGALDQAAGFAEQNWREPTEADVWGEYDLPRLKQSRTNDALKAYLQIRGHSDVPMLKNPVLFVDQRQLVKLNPEDVQTLTVASSEIPAGALVTTGSDKFLHEVRVYADVPRPKRLHSIAKKDFDESLHPRNPAGSGDKSGEFANSAAILQGIDSKANTERQVKQHLDRWQKHFGGVRDITPEDLQERETELRELPLVHGTTIYGAIGAATSGLVSHREMQKQASKLLEESQALRDEIEKRWPTEEDWSTYTVEDIRSVLGLDRSDAEDMAEKIRELNSIESVLSGKTYPADEKLGLDRFVFMTHGAKHPDYGDVAVIIDNKLIQEGWATEHDIVSMPNAQIGNFVGQWGEFHADALTAYKETIVKGEDYYKVAAAKGGYLPNRDRQQLFEIKVPQVPKSAVKGFVVEQNLETAQHLAAALASKGLKNKVLYIGEVYNMETKEFLLAQMKTMQSLGFWDKGAVEDFNERHDGLGGVHPMSDLLTQTMAKEDALVRGRELVQDIRALLKKSNPPIDKSYATILKWNEHEHPREPQGSATGGQFTSAASAPDAGAGRSRGSAVSPSAAKGRPDAVPAAQAIADSYNARVGLPPVQHGYVAVDEARAGTIADAYDALPLHDEDNPAVQTAYEALATEIQAQWDHITSSGIQMVPWTKEGQPYATSTEMAEDVRTNQRLYFFTGGDPNRFMAKADANGLTINDKFRAVHDFFGHAAGGYGFGARGEENAWVSHSQMLSSQARRALTTETRGQNSWVNFGRQNYHPDGTYRNIPPGDRPFATQKAALLPDIYALLPGETVLKWDESQHPRDDEGQFTRVAMTSQRPDDDPEHKENKDVFKHMRQFEAQLKELPGVSRVSVKPGVGGWNGGSESMWQIYYRGNGAARKLVAQTAKQYNQDSVLVLNKCHKGADCQPAVELFFRGGISPTTREHIHATLLAHGITGWTWMKRDGKSLLRMVNVPPWSTWGGDGVKHQQATATISRELHEYGIDNFRKVHKVGVSIMEREGAHSYDAIIGG